MEFTPEELNLISYTLRNSYYDKVELRMKATYGTPQWNRLTVELLRLDRLVEKIVDARYA